MTEIYLGLIQIPTPYLSLREPGVGHTYRSPDTAMVMVVG